MEERAAKEGVGSLYRQLESIDPVSARKIAPGNLRRVIRVLEVYQATHIPFSQLQDKKLPPFNTIILGLTTQRDELYRLIDHRIDNMIEQGLVQEVKGLADKGYGFSLPAMSSVGYKQIGHFIQGKVDLDTAIQRTKFETHRFARHQYAWFGLNDPRIRWFDMQKQVGQNILQLVRKEIEES